MVGAVAGNASVTLVMPYKDPVERQRVRSDWRRCQKLALKLAKADASGKGLPVAELTLKNIPPEFVVEAKRLTKEGRVPTKERSRFTPHRAAPPPLPLDTLTIQLDDPKSLPDELYKYGHARLTLFLAELPATGDVQIVASKAGLPVSIMLRRCQEGEVDHREGRPTWNAALFRAVSQGVASAMAFGLLSLRSLMPVSPPVKKGEDPAPPTPSAVRLRACETYLRMAFPDRFRNGSGGGRGGFLPGAPEVNVGVSVNVGDVGPVAPPSPEILALMHGIKAGDLEATLRMIESGEI